MSLLDKASLIVTPNAYKESKLYSVVPSSGAGDMDVVRATTATRVNSAGLIEVVPRNLVQYSQDFDNAYWTKGNTSIVSNQTNAPDGTLTADKSIIDSSNSFHDAAIGAFQQISGNKYTVSIHAKKSVGIEAVYFYIDDGGRIAKFNLNNGAYIGNAGGNGFAAFLSYTTETLQNGWYRFTATYLATANQSISFVLGISTNTNNTVTALSGNGTDNLFIWGAQVDQFETATEYFPTTTRLNIPRIDYTNGSCPSLLVEPQRTNITLQSENLATTWYTANCLLDSNATTSPDGTTTADKIKADTTNGIHVYQQTLTVSNATAYTMSVFVKAGEYTFFELADASSLKAQTFNLTTKTISAPQTGGFSAATSSKIEDYGNGWLRCSITYTTVGVTAFFRMSLSNGTTTSFAGNNTNGLFVWGAQLEAGSYATSYIPTVASSVTRNADVISKTGISSLIGQTEGTMFCEIQNWQTQLDKVILALSDGSTANYLQISSNSVTGDLQSVIFTGGAPALLGSIVPVIGQNYKIAIGYKLNDYAMYINGVQVGTFNSKAAPSSLTRFDIGSVEFLASNYQPRTPYKSAQVYKTRLTNTELAQLTTL